MSIVNSGPSWWPRRQPHEIEPGFDPHPGAVNTMKSVMKAVDDGIISTVQANFGTRTVRPRDINAVANAIDQVDSKIARNVTEREELYRERDALHAELNTLCAAITDNAQRVREHYLGTDKEPEPAVKEESNEGHQEQPPRTDTSVVE